MNYSFKKEERISSNEKIKSLYKNGESFLAYPFLIFWKILEEESPISTQIAISVPKRKIKRAVDRNFIKRRIRESYRLRKSELNQFLSEHNKKIEILLVYTNTEKLGFKQIDEKMKSMFMKFEAEFLRSLS